MLLSVPITGNLQLLHSFFDILRTKWHKGTIYLCCIPECIYISSISPMAMGCFICVNINPLLVLIDICNFVLSGGILFKMLVMGINEMVFAFPLKF